MLATSARSVPDIALAWRELPAALNCRRFSTFSTVTSGVSRWDSVPSGPFTEISPAVMATSTLSGSVMGKFPILDMARVPLCHEAQYFAADAQPARLAVGHYAARGRDDRHAQPVHHLRNVVLGAVNTQARAAHPLDLLDHRLAGVVLEADLERAHAFQLAHCEVLDVALVLQHLRDRRLYLAGGHRHRLLLRALPVADARQHVGDGIGHTHMRSSPPCYQLALITPGISPWSAMMRSFPRASPNLR